MSELLLEHAALALAIIVVTHFIGAIAVFGSSLLAVPPLLLLYGPESLPLVLFVLVIVGLLQAILLAMRNWRAADGRFCFRLLLGSATGLPLGMVLTSVLPGRAVMILLGLLTLAAGVSNGLSARIKPSARVRRWAFPIALATGLIHGAYASGGTVLVAYAQRAMPDRDTFRATLAVYWTLLNIGFVAALFIRARPDGPALLMTGTVAMIVLSVTVLADRTARHINPRHFQWGVSALLVISGLALLGSQV
ncbi:MAG: TSUP family transporter [Puniceicoccaceae bacterium]